MIKMEEVQEQLQHWGELIITTDAGETYEIHLGDTEFDKENRVLQFTTPDAKIVIDGDTIESVKMHFSHKMSD
ncbi:hypothetical protein NZD89_03200 [Alicyclobacillus fastidiosus]|uniref:Uncharacterized protein n=1 Tax=Alicyclobacillus fastidiosus TaxID=392011 RepID=A0ABY6ZI60_9BACL|nr:hypothetical protein [Alicyclobacillus fastidiosus]WAH42511.1 hypothetical protein NZD89_03200 [Alicyclobacillus fastidiosus]GMA64351.1 hypothetical protein GCM10025859_47910 [Alicyclobacillus fastidiosus]